jgi:hypothetical protein
LSAGGPPPSPYLAQIDPSIPFAVWLKDFSLEFKDVVNPSKALPHLQSADIFHHLTSTGLLISSTFCWLDGEKLHGQRRNLTSWREMTWSTVLVLCPHLFI